MKALMELFLSCTGAFCVAISLIALVGRILACQPRSGRRKIPLALFLAPALTDRGDASLTDS